MSDQPTQVWGTSHDSAPEPDDARHAVPAETPEPQPATSYGEFFEHPPYATEDAPMTVDLPSVQAPVVPLPVPEESRPVVDDSSREQVTCPECGATQQVHLNRRDAVDFCQRCDFPLFWTPARVSRDWNPTGSAEALRRMPGTGGSTRLASTACPHCAELNAVSADLCVRCGRSMQVIVPPPPAYIPPPPPPPVYEPEPEPSVAWWVWTLLGLTVVLLVGFGILWATGTIG